MESSEKTGTFLTSEQINTLIGKILLEQQRLGDYLESTGGGKAPGTAEEMAKERGGEERKSGVCTGRDYFSNIKLEELSDFFKIKIEDLEIMPIENSLVLEDYFRENKGVFSDDAEIQGITDFEAGEISDRAFKNAVDEYDKSKLPELKLDDLNLKSDPEGGAESRK